jgi:hypothetical protein
MEPENVKFFALAISAICAKYLGTAASNTGGEIDKWIERGGTGLCLILLIFAVRSLRTERNERQKRLDDIHDRDIEANNKATEARVQLATSMDKQADAIDKQANALDRLTDIITRK